MMKGNMMVFAPLCLLLCWMLPVDSMMIRSNLILQDAKMNTTLSMVTESVDDSYIGCNKEMAEKIYKTYFEEEKNASRFRVAWQEAENCSENSLRNRDKKDKNLTKDHMQAICVYTSRCLYKEFNDAVRTEGRNYNSSFKFHSLHFLLTSAIQILKQSGKLCYSTYRRTKVVFIGKVNDIFRFGSFASSSLKTNLKDFGNKTCFKIKTCYGAYLKNYSYYDQEEEEVLIPPYEKFKITKTTNGQSTIQGLNDCEIVYEVESVGQESNLKCMLVS